MTARRIALAVLAAAGAGAAEVEISAVGTVAVDSGATTALAPPAKELVVTSTGADARRVAAGEVVLRFSTGMIRNHLDDLRRAAAIARLAQGVEAARRAGEIEELETERRRLRAELAAVDAAIAVASRPDGERVSLLDAQRRQAVLAAEIATRDAERRTAEGAQGRASAADVAEAARQAGLARLAIAGPELAWRLAQAPAEGVDLASLRARRQDLALRLGLDDDGSESPERGVGARLAALRTRIDADLAAGRAELERTESELRQAERDSADRTPVAWVEVTAAGAAQPLARVRFLPSGRAAPEGFAPDHGRAFDGTRGWDRDLGEDELLWREASSGGDPARSSRRRRGGGGGGGFAGGVAVLGAPAAWALTVAPGTYRVRLGLGDARDWDGPSVRIEGTAIGLPQRLGPGIAEFASEVRVEDGRIDIVFGDGEEKALRAPAPGMVLLQPGTAVGMRITDISWPLAYLAEPSQLVVDALVPQELAPALAATPAADGAPLEGRLRLSAVTLRRSDGSAIPAEVVSIGAQSVRWLRGTREWGGGNPADNIARELRLRPAGGTDAGLRPGEAVTVALRFAVPPDATVLPPHLVRIDRGGAAVLDETGERSVEAVRLGGSVVVAGRFDPARLSPPGAPRQGPLDDGQGRFLGEVVPGVRTRVAIGWVWGRVESMAADGSMVAAGDVVMTLYNPQIEADRERIERERQAAVRNVLAAAERRRQERLRVQAEHLARVAAETEARIRLRGYLEPDVLGDAASAAARERAASDLAAALAARERLASLSHPGEDDLRAAIAGVARAGIAVDRAALDAAAHELRTDWLALGGLAAAWRDAADRLGLRGQELAEAALQERIDALGQRIAMERAIEGTRWQRYFEDHRRVRAPVSGRLLVQTGWNDQTQRSEKVGKEFLVWGGMTVAEIVDESQLSFSAELPEDRYPRLAAGRACELTFAAAPGRTVPAVLREIGRAFTIPRDRLSGEGPVSSQRAFTAVVSFTPPDDLRPRLTTGAKGWLRIP